jgi:hypothetical protein
MSVQSTHIIDMVIAHYNEDLSWLDYVRPFVRMFVYHKGNNPNNDYIIVNNVGRESHTYLTHIINNYDNLADVTLFLQGRITDHIPSYLGIYTYIESLVSDGLQNGNSSNIAHGVETEFRPFNISRMKFGAETFQQWFKRILGMNIPSEGYMWYVGALMCIRRDMIHSRPLEFYKTLLSEVDHDINPEQGHFFERAWYYIFKCDENDFHKTLCEMVKGPPPQPHQQ